MQPEPETVFATERDWLESTLRDRIALAGFMDLRVNRLDETGIRLDFPLPPSINDKGTGFGGALASAMILAGWSLPRLALRRHGLAAELVIGRCQLRFTAPVRSAYSACCDWPADEALESFLTATRGEGKGRLDLAVRIETEGGVAATLEARYAALTPNQEGS